MYNWKTSLSSYAQCQVYVLQTALFYLQEIPRKCIYEQSCAMHSGKNSCLCRWRENSCNIFPNGMCIFPPECKDDGTRGLYTYSFS